MAQLMLNWEYHPLAVTEEPKTRPAVWPFWAAPALSVRLAVPPALVATLSFARAWGEAPE